MPRLRGLTRRRARFCAALLSLALLAGPCLGSAEAAAPPFIQVLPPSMVLEPAPRISSLVPPQTSEDGGTVAINGANLSQAKSVTVGASTATILSRSANRLTVAIPKHAGRGTVPLIVHGPVRSAAVPFVYVGPLISSISPSQGSELGGTVVTLAGTGLNSVVSVSFGGAAAAILTRTGSTQMTVRAPPSPTGQPGGAHVTLSDGVSVSPTTSADLYTYVAPTILSITPAGGPDTGGTVVTLTGVGLSGMNSVHFGGTAGAIGAIKSDTSATVVSPAGIGTVHIVVSDGVKSSATSLADQFTYGAPVITAVSPRMGALAGSTSVTISGTNLGAVNTVKFGAAAGTVISASATSATVVSPPGAGTVDIVVSDPKASSSVSAADRFSYVAPQITSISPASGSDLGGTTVTITGSGLSKITGVKFGAAAGIVGTISSDQKMTVSSPAGTGAVHVVVSDGAATSPATPSDLFTYDVPTITSVSPSSGPEVGGIPVQINGTNLSGITSLVWNGVSIPNFKHSSSTGLTLTLPPHLGAGTVTLSASDGVATAQAQFTYTGPALRAISPASGPDVGGTQLTLSGAGLTGVQNVWFGSTPAAKFTVSSDSTITVTSPPGTGTQHITVSDGSLISATSAADQFVFSPPSVTALSPASGSEGGGTKVTITGTNMAAVNSVTFGAAPAAILSHSGASSVTVVAPAALAAGKVNVIVGDGIGSSQAVTASQFTYVKPAITSISPNSGPDTGATTVTLTGTGLAGVQRVAFGKTPAPIGKITDDTKMTVISPPGSGSADITVFDGIASSTVSTADRFTFVAPSISHISPSSGSEAGGVSVLLTGANLGGVNSVTIGGVPVTITGRSGTTTITVTTQAHAKGAAPIVVTDGIGTSTVSTASQFTFVGPSLASISPNKGSAAGGTSVTLTGAGLAGAQTVKFGGTIVPVVSIQGDTSLTAKSPPGTGSVQVTVFDGTSSSNGLTFTYS